MIEIAIEKPGIITRISQAFEGRRKHKKPEDRALEIIAELNQTYTRIQKNYQRKIQTAGSQNEQYALISELKNSFLANLGLQLIITPREVKRALKAAFEIQAELDKQVYEKTRQNRHRESALLNERAAGVVQMELEGRLEFNAQYIRH